MKRVMICLGLSLFTLNAFPVPPGYSFNARNVRGYDGNRPISDRYIDYNHGSESGGRHYHSTSGDSGTSTASSSSGSSGAVSPWANQPGILFHNKIPEGFATGNDKAECEKKAKEQATAALAELENKCKAEKFHFGIAPRFSYPDQSTPENKKDFVKALRILDSPGSFEIASARIESIAGSTAMSGKIKFACLFNQFNYATNQAVVWNQSIEFSGDMSVSLLAAYFEKTEANHYESDRPVRITSLLGTQIHEHCKALNPDPTKLQHTGVILESSEPLTASYGSSEQGAYTCLARSTARFACAPAPAGYSRPWDDISPGRTMLGDTLLTYFWVSDFR